MCRGRGRLIRAIRYLSVANHSSRLRKNMRRSAKCGQTMSPWNIVMVAEVNMNHLQFAAATKRAKFWSGVAYLATAVPLMAITWAIAVAFSPQIDPFLENFRDTTKRVQDDGSYGAAVGISIGLAFVLPCLCLPLLTVIWVHRKLGVACPHCKALLSLRISAARTVESEACCFCKSKLFEPPKTGTDQE